MNVAGHVGPTGDCGLVSGGVLTGKSKCRFQDLFVVGIVVAWLSIGAYSENSGTVFLVRHAEKASTARDTALSVQGVKRAECLAHTLGGTGVQSFSQQDLSVPERPLDR
jgi:hypothetical protein